MGTLALLVACVLLVVAIELENEEEEKWRLFMI